MDCDTPKYIGNMVIDHGYWENDVEHPHRFSMDISMSLCFRIRLCPKLAYSWGTWWSIDDPPWNFSNFRGEPENFQINPWRPLDEASDSDRLFLWSISTNRAKAATAQFSTVINNDSNKNHHKKTGKWRIKWLLITMKNTSI